MGRVARHLRIKKVGKQFQLLERRILMTNMDKQLIAGTFTFVKGNEGLDFWAKLGVAEKDAKAFVGSHWTMKIGYDDEKMWVKVNSDEFPSMNLFMSSLEEGKEYSIPDKGFGKSSMVFSSIPDKPTMVHTITNTERFGSYDVMETYTEEGIKMEYFSKDKVVSFVENWSRVVKDIGSFRFKRGENLEIFTNMFPGFPKLDEGYKVKLSKVGDSFLEVATFGDGTTFATPWKYDEEAPFLDCIFLMTRIPGGNKVICRKPTGQIQEYTTKFTDAGMFQQVVDQTTGKIVCVEFIRFVDLTGEFKPLTSVGGANIAFAMGWPAEIYQKMMSDPSTRMVIKEDGCQYVVHFKSDSMPKEMPQDETVFKLGEEFEWKNPFDPTDTFKMVATACENTLLVAGKGKVSMKAKYTFTENFVIREMEIAGAGMAEKVIFARC